MIASATNAAYAMPAAGWAAESGNPVLFVGSSGVPAATRQALLAHQSPHIYVLGPPSVIPNATLAQLRRYGPVKRVGASRSGRELGGVRRVSRSPVRLRAAVRARAQQLRLGDSQPRSRLRPDERPAPARRRCRCAALGQWRLRSPTAGRQSH